MVQKVTCGGNRATGTLEAATFIKVNPTPKGRSNRGVVWIPCVSVDRVPRRCSCSGQTQRLSSPSYVRRQWMPSWLPWAAWRSCARRGRAVWLHGGRWRWRNRLLLPGRCGRRVLPRTCASTSSVTRTFWCRKSAWVSRPSPPHLLILPAPGRGALHAYAAAARRINVHTTLSSRSRDFTQAELKSPCPDPTQENRPGSPRARSQVHQGSDPWCTCQRPLARLSLGHARQGGVREGDVS